MLGTRGPTVSADRAGEYGFWFFNWREVELRGFEELVEGEFESRGNVGKLHVLNRRGVLRNISVIVHFQSHLRIVLLYQILDLRSNAEPDHGSFGPEVAPR